MSYRGFSTHGFLRSPKGLLGFLIFVAAVAVACSGGESAPAAPASPAASSAPSPGSNETSLATERPADAAPDFELTLFGNANHKAGETLRLSDLQGHPVVLNFWYPSCPPCRAEMPDLEEAFQAHRGQGVEFVGVEELILDTVQDGQDFVDEIGVTYALGADVEGDLLKEYGIVGFPTTVFIDSDQKIVRKWTGILNAKKIDELIGDLLD